ncbi:MAG TPA: hypothetical protein VLA52_02585, partial [Thermohalobaculum sp.]|nr:hypothetical protein [Thermohalobaculum sp.]
MTERAGRSSPRHWGKLALGLTSGVAALAVAACNTTGTGGAPGTVQSNPGATVQDTALPARPSAPVLEPVPLLFRAEAWALWDGGRTLDGIWVALPDADRSRRVRITNEDNGATVDGALLPSRSDGRGPAMEISAEAARALGIKPGAPAAVVVVALEYALPPGAEPRMATESPPDLAPVLAAEAGPAPDPVEPGTDAALAAGDGEPGAAQAADPAPVAEIAAVPAVPAAHEPGREERQAPAAEAAPEAPAAITAEAEPAPADAAGTVAVTSAPPPPESAPPAQPAAAPPVIAGVAAILRPPAGPADPPAASEAPARPT